jgi:hypothetical protein
MTRDDRKRIFAKYSSTIEHAEKKGFYPIFADGWVKALNA